MNWQNWGNDEIGNESEKKECVRGRGKKVEKDLKNIWNCIGEKSKLQWQRKVNR